MSFRAFGLMSLATVLIGCNGSSDGDSATADSGLDFRPSNMSCVAPERSTGNAGVETPRAFPNLTFASPIAFKQAPGDPSRWFVVEQGGVIRVFENNPAVSATQKFIDFNGRVGFADGSGLYGLAFHPDFAVNGRAYVHYVGASGGSRRSIISEFVSPDGGQTLDPNSERVLFSAAMSPSNRGGGNIAFGPDKFLYIGLADRMLRIDVDARPPAAPEIYALGLRNPWRWSFDRRTGELWLGDVGQVSGVGPSITGGHVYRGKQSTGLAGRYVFGDVGGMIATLAPDGSGGFKVVPLVNAGVTPAGAPGPLQISAFGEGEDGELYVLDFARGHVRQLVFTGSGREQNVPELLSETGCVNMNAAGAPPMLSLIPFSPNAVLWSDGAVKDRWFGLPDGQSIAVQSSGDWDFPNGTVLVKHFRLGSQLIETRLFMRHPDGVWAGYTYHWNEAQTEATRVVDGLTVPVDGQDYIIPSEADCLWCHNEAAGFSLGPETAQANGTILYPQTGRSANQIATLNAFDVLTPPVGANAPAYASHTDASANLDARARAYLHVNCSICHRPGGPTPASMDLRHDTPLPAAEACDVVPTLGDLGIPDARIIAPGDSARSELLSRMSRRDGFGMPPLASNLPDPAGVALIRDWIDSLDVASCE